MSGAIKHAHWSTKRARNLEADQRSDSLLGFLKRLRVHNLLALIPQNSRSLGSTQADCPRTGNVALDLPHADWDLQVSGGRRKWKDDSKLQAAISRAS